MFNESTTTIHPQFGNMDVKFRSKNGKNRPGEKSKGHKVIEGVYEKVL